MVHEEVDIPQETKQALDALSILSQKWEPVVIAVLSNSGNSGFNELLDRIPDISGKVLSETLEALESAGLVTRTVISESPLRVEYGLSDAGRDLDLVFDELADWSETHLDAGTPTVFIAEKDRRATEMYRNWLSDQYRVLCAHNSEQIDRKLDDNVDIVLFGRRIPGVDPTRVPAVTGPDCPSILLDYGDHPSDEIDCDFVLSKPLVRETIVDAIETALSHPENEA